jgi:hypothetical protein
VIGEDIIAFGEKNGQTLSTVVGSLDSSVWNADGFVWMFSPEEWVYGSNKEVPYIVVTYKLEYIENIDGTVLDRFYLEISDGGSVIGNQTTYNANAGYEAYHLRDSGYPY